MVIAGQHIFEKMALRLKQSPSVYFLVWAGMIFYKSSFKRYSLFRVRQLLCADHDWYWGLDVWMRVLILPLVLGRVGR